MKTAQVHRFGDCVAVSLPDGKTCYLTPKDARRIAKQLQECARDVNLVPFVNSQYATWEWALVDTGHNGTTFSYRG